MEVSAGGNGDGDGVAVGVEVGVEVGISVCVSVIAISITFVGPAAGVDMRPLQDVSNIETRKNGSIVLSKVFIFTCSLVVGDDYVSAIRMKAVSETVVLDPCARFKLPADVYRQDLVFRIHLF